MPQNIYDDPEFFAGYQRLRAAKPGLPEFLEQPALRSLLPDVRGNRTLDLGCGAGDMSRWLAKHGAASVVGTDVSERMLEKARAVRTRGSPSSRARQERWIFRGRPLTWASVYQCSTM